MSKIYSNSMLALLNNRIIIIGGRNTVDPFETAEISLGVLDSVTRDHLVTSIVTMGQAQATNEL